MGLKLGLRDCFLNIGIRVDTGCRVDDVELRLFDLVMTLRCRGLRIQRSWVLRLLS